MTIAAIILALLLVASLLYIVKLSRQKPPAADAVQIATKEILNHDVGAVLIISDSDEVLYYNNEFVALFPKIATAKTMAEYPAMKKLFAAKEYVSEELSKIYEIRSEWLATESFSGRFVWLVDITGHYKTNKKLQELKDMADAANKAKSNFLANMSHEIRTPINTILGMDEIIIREATEKPIIGYAENIRDASTTLLSLVNDLLDFSKIECGKMEILPVEYEIANVLSEIINMIEIKVANKGLDFNAVVAEDIPYLLYGDDVRLRQIIINLLTNAVKYTKEGSVVLKVDWKEAGDSSINLIVSVTDTGIGIKEEDLDKLFVSFERIEEKRNRNIEGTGLGLSITRQLLELMGSELNVRSDYGVGSTFSFVLKQGIRDRKPIGKFREKYAYSREKHKKYRTTFVAPNARILVVDDNAMNISVVEGLLKSTQIKVDKASGGLEALDLCAENYYDLILMDHMMPNIDGIETLHRLKAAEGPNQDTPVIVLTANAISGAKEMYEAEGFIDYMSKPIQGKPLEEKILEYLPENRYVLVEYDKVEQDIFSKLWKAIANEILAEYHFKHIDVPSAVESAEGSKETFRFLLQSFHDNASKNKNDILTSYETEDYANYTIYVHALKSTSKMIGALVLSEKARLLELAGKEGKIDYIKDSHEEVMNLFDEVMDEISDYLTKVKPEEPETDSPEVDENVAKALEEANQQQ
jgi:signal transduction histidine kinase/CheY-like chemotaxis protein/HPt (histidine-containing phosphotransfer) domain-containing protein